MDNFTEKIKHGDKSAFEELVTQYQSKVFSLCMGLVSNREDALDLTQEVFIKIYRNAKSFKGDSKLSTWIYRITKNTCIDFLRKEKRITLEELPDFAADPAPSPFETVAALEDREKVRAAIAKLPVNFRSVLLMREYADLSYEEIASAAEISVGTVKSRISRARAMLYKILSEEQEQ